MKKRQDFNPLCTLYRAVSWIANCENCICRIDAVRFSSLYLFWRIHWAFCYKYYITNIVLGQYNICNIILITKSNNFNRFTVHSSFAQFSHYFEVLLFFKGQKSTNRPHLICRHCPSLHQLSDNLKYVCIM